MIINIVGASSGKPHLTDGRPVMTAGYQDAKGQPGLTWVCSSVFKKLDFQDQVSLIWDLHVDTEDRLDGQDYRAMTRDRLEWQRMAKQYGPVFSSTVAWMLCYAIEQGAKVINLFGLDMATQTEYAEQRDTVYYWIGRAEAAGIVVNIPTASRLFFKDRIYGVM